MCKLPTESNTINSSISQNVHNNISSSTALDLSKRTKRYNIWELGARYHCSLIGTCLTLKELHQLAAKVGFGKAQIISDYDLHVSFVHVLDQKCYASLLVNKLLNKKYKSSVQQFSKAKTDDARLVAWKQALKIGNVAGAFWALISHPASSEELQYKAYGNIHMLSHISGASLRLDIQELHQLREQNQELEQQAKQIQLGIREKSIIKDDKIKSLTSQLLNAKQENSVLKKAEKELESVKNKPIVESLQAQVAKLSITQAHDQSRVDRAEISEEIWKQRAQREQQHAQELKQKLFVLQEEKQAIEESLTVLLVKQNSDVGDCTTCLEPDTDLCGRCILYVGGRNKQNSHFRKLVEQQNGQFIHHDGGREDSYQRLASIVSQADIVLCPMDCVSHAAMNTVKRHCDHHTKPLIFIPHASLSSFAQGLKEVMG
ncbi:MAG: DUF2325 domain-containing protein [Cocleimonas sp.]|nr:DUF2325 domain-containing protein [Cocleimonas sp.]